MKLRFRGNSLRLRLNQREVSCLAKGETLAEQIAFPNSSHLGFLLEPLAAGSEHVTFSNGEIRIGASHRQFATWAASEDIGVYFEVPTDATPLKVAIEKDLECIDEAPEERDPYAYPRAAAKC